MAKARYSHLSGSIPEAEKFKVKRLNLYRYVFALLPRLVLDSWAQVVFPLSLPKCCDYRRSKNNLGKSPTQENIVCDCLDKISMSQIVVFLCLVSQNEEDV
ncbi:hypothetical protein AAY473_008977, partial [Plecturocebus cupreus]